MCTAFISLASTNVKRAYPVTDDASLKEATQRDEYETDLSVVEVDASSDLSRLSVSGQPALAPSVSPFSANSDLDKP